ncbi:MAG TPA: hypothetical protein VLW17_05675 [Thermoanaerobaculaceae bacterium]|nr:hypothetical protein [Thermoanaerobaculaceae bacterium]
MTIGRERGEGKLGCVLGLAVLVVAAVVGVKAVPVRLAVADLEDYCVHEAERASVMREHDGRTPEQQIADGILLEAEKENLPVAKDQIKVWRDSEEEHIEVKYRVSIDFIVYTYNWDVVHRVDRNRF